MFFRRPRRLNIDIPNHPIIGGDKKCFLISAASIVAKVYRDNLMHQMDIKFPGFNFSKHKGYPTAEHLNLITRVLKISKIFFSYIVSHF